MTRPPGILSSVHARVQLLASASLLCGSLGHAAGAPLPSSLYEVPFTLVSSVTAAFDVASGDLNGDGRADLVVSSGNGGSMSALLGDGQGGFALAASVGGFTVAGPVALGDMDGDGHQDAILGDMSLSRVTVVYGDGTGEFPRRRDISVAAAIGVLSVGDLDGDGRLDIVALGGATLHTIFNLGNDIWWVRMWPIAAPASGVVVRDFSGDGHPDIAVSEWGYAPEPGLQVFVFAGNYTLSAPASFVVPNYGAGVTATDADGDGVLDLVVPTGTWAQTSAFHGTGTGGFTTRTEYPWSMRDPEARDVTGDGLADLVGWLPDGSLFVHARLPGGGFDPLARESLTPVNPTGHALLDADQDGAWDDVTVSATSVACLRGNGDGTFGPRTFSQAGFTPQSLAAGDFDGDGRLDVVCGGYAAGLSVLKGAADGTFASRVVLSPHVPSSIFVHDLDGDAQQDLVVIDGYVRPDTVDVEVYRGHGDGTFELSFAAAFPQNSPAGADVGDVDGDGVPDVVLTTVNQSIGFPDRPAGDAALLSAYGDPTLRIMHGVGDGTFTLLPPVPSEDDDFAALADINGDGILDWVTAYWNGGQGGTVDVRLGDGAGHFVQTSRSVLTAVPTCLALGDLNGDSHLDVAVETGSGSAALLLGAGDGSLGVPAYVATATAAYRLALADVDGDGILDLAVANPQGSVAVLQGQGDGTMAAPVVYPTGVSTQAFLLADVTGDRRPDFVLPRPDPNSLFALLHASTTPTGVDPPTREIGKLRVSWVSRRAVDFRVPPAVSDHARIEVFDISGRRLARLAASGGRARWDARTTAGREVGAGVYMGVLRDGEVRAAARFVVPR